MYFRTGRPSYHQGFARSSGESKYPDLWKGLVGAWCPFLGVTGSQLFDITRNGTTGEFYDNPLWTISSGGHCIDFDGTGNHHINITNPRNPIGNSTRTYIFAVEIDAFQTSNTDTLIGTNVAGNGEGVRIYAEDNAISVGYSGHRVITPKSALSTGVKYTIAFRVPSGATTTSQCEVFIDGVNQSLSNEGGTSRTLDTVDTSLCIGGAASNATGTSSEDESDCRIFYTYVYDRPLSDSEILQIHNNQFAPFELADRPFGLVVIAGGIAITPSPITCVADKVDPVVMLGSLSLTPSPTTSVSDKVDPAIELGSLSLTLSPISAISETLNPIVELGSISFIPSPSTSVGGKVDPIVVLGSLSVTPGTTTAIGSTVDPTVDVSVPGGVLIVPAPVTAVGDTINPTVVLSSLAITPSPSVAISGRVNPIIVLGGLSLTPSPVSSVGVTIDPTVTLGSILIVPVAASAIASVVDASLILGSISITPTSTAVIVDTIDPVVLAGIPSISIASEVRVITIDTRRRTINIDTARRIITKH
jgi:hypothetical protein